VTRRRRATDGAARRPTTQTHTSSTSSHQRVTDTLRHDATAAAHGAPSFAQDSRRDLNSSADRHLYTTTPRQLHYPFRLYCS
jgi:hypothetical protein